MDDSRCKKYFDYDAGTGFFRIKERPREEFTTSSLWKRHLGQVGKIVGSQNRDGYIKVHMDGKYYSAHRIAWLIMTGEHVKYPDFEIDHINGNRSDNRFSNLRKVTKSENQRNGSKRLNNTSGVHGVNWKAGKDRWVARIWNGPKHIYLGQFRTLEEAAIARRAAERALGFTGTEREPYNIKKTKDQL